MRKFITWVLIALMALQCVAFAENSAATAVSAVNGGDMVRTTTDIYMAIPSGEREMLVRIPLAGGDPICVDRADHFEDLMPYAGGVAYLKTTDGSSAIMNCVGNNVSTIPPAAFLPTAASCWYSPAACSIPSSPAPSCA